MASPGEHHRRRSKRRFAYLPVDVLDSRAVKTLGHAAFRVLALMAAQFQGFNNGALGVTAKQAAENGIRSDTTFYRALRALQAHNLIEATYPSSRKPPRPAMFALTWVALDDTNKRLLDGKWVGTFEGRGAITETVYTNRQVTFVINEGSSKGTYCSFGQGPFNLPPFRERKGREKGTF